MKLRVGSIVKVAPDNDNEHYDNFRGRLLEVTNIYRSSKDNPFYDEGMAGQALCGLSDYVNPNKHILYALYEYELELYRY